MTHWLSGSCITEPTGWDGLRLYKAKMTLGGRFVHDQRFGWEGDSECYSNENKSMSIKRSWKTVNFYLYISIFYFHSTPIVTGLIFDSFLQVMAFRQVSLLLRLPIDSLSYRHRQASISILNTCKHPFQFPKCSLPLITMGYIIA